MEIEYRGNSYFIEKYNNESDDMFFKRGWFIIKNEPNTSEKMDYLTKISNHWINYKFLGCKYIDTIQQQLYELDNIISNKN